MRQLAILGAVALVAAAPLYSQAAPADAERQLAQAVSAAPDSLRAGATVLGWADGKTVTLRKGTNGLTCLADQPGDKEFHAACYQDGLEPFMARGRALRAAKIGRKTIEEMRRKDIAAGKYRIPAGATLYNYAAPADSVDPATGVPPRGSRWYVVYLPGATEKSVGASTTPDDSGRPWLMYPGEPWAHLMITPR